MHLPSPFLPSDAPLARRLCTLQGKRVAVIGTGASSIQVVAALAPVCGHLSVFQRTPAWVLPKYNFTFPNWATLVMRYVPGQRWLFRQLLFWQREIHMAPAFFKPGGLESRLLTLTGAHMTHGKSPYQG